MCEKAFTINSKEAIELVELARKHNVFLMEAMVSYIAQMIVTNVVYYMYVFSGQDSFLLF